MLERRTGLSSTEFVGANTIAIIYSLVKTAKVNNLMPYNYFDYLLTKGPQHMDDHDANFCEASLPWSVKNQEEYKWYLVT